MKDTQAFETEIGYRFKNRELLQLAMTHASHSVQNNERLEFLGDAVLELISSAYLYEKFPRQGEGFLTKRRAEMVCEASLARWARSVRLGEHLLLGKSELLNGGTGKSSILSDAAEAVIGAVYLDSGERDAKQLVEKILAFIDANAQNDAADAKSALQVMLQRNGNVDIRYETVDTTGPPHDMTFFVTVSVNGKCIADGKGKSKKAAEQDAASKALVLYSK